MGYLLAWILAVEVRQGTLGLDGRDWGPAGNTGRGWSWLSPGREHWVWMVVVEVRQRTLGLDGRGWGPAENTVDRGSQLDEDNEDDEEDKEDEEEEDEAGGGRRKAEGGRQEEAATDIKSNNPHLAGGEKLILICRILEKLKSRSQNLDLYYIYYRDLLRYIFKYIYIINEFNLSSPRKIENI